MAATTLELSFLVLVALLLLEQCGEEINAFGQMLVQLIKIFNAELTLKPSLKYKSK